MEEYQDYDDFYDHPLVINEIDYSKPLHPTTKAILDMRYEGSPEENALNYKEEGNYLFSKGDYKTALDNYNEGIKIYNGDPNKILLCQLYTNAGICYRKLTKHQLALDYARRALEYDLNNIKALSLVASSYLSLVDYDKAVHHFSAALAVHPNDPNLIKLANEANKLKVVNQNRIIETEIKRQANEVEQREVAMAIKARKIRLKNCKNIKDLKLKKIYQLTQPPEHFIHHVYLKEGALHWPIAFTFPEPRITDFVMDFDENNRMSEALDIVLSGLLEWDTNGDYTAQLIEIYYQDDLKLFKINKENKLKSIICGKNISISDGVVALTILSSQSDFCSKYKTIYK